MAAEDRERSFEQALQRHLRTSQGAATPLRPDANAPTSACLDPETLAAYHERSLLPEEMNASKEHIVGCARCQGILAQLEITDSVPLERVAGEVEVVAAAAPEKARRPVPIRGARWAWLVPAGAVAAGLIAWVGLHEGQRQGLLSRSNEIKMAKAQEPAPPMPAPLATHQVPASPSTDQIATLSDNARAREEAPTAGGGVLSGDRAREAERLNQLYAMKQPSSKVAVPAKPAAGAAGVAKELRKDELRDSSVTLTKPVENQADLDAKNASVDKNAPVPQSLQQVEVQAQAVNNQGQNQQNQIQSQRVFGPNPGPAKKQKSDSSLYRAAAAPPPAPQPPASAPQQSGAPAGFASSALEVAAITNPHLISAPGTSFVWRAGRAGLIEFSSDGGRTWSRQTSGVLTDLTTGASPSSNVCWMVGRVGAILLTVDGGAHWTLLRAPLSDDLGGIRATDAQHATVWNLRKTKSFETSDGGVTWKPVPAP